MKELLEYKSNKDHEGWVLKNWCFRTVVLEKTLESPLDCKEIKPVNPKGDQPWILTGRTDAEAEAPILWPRIRKSQLIGKDPDAGKDWGQKEKGETEDEVVGCHHWLNGHEFEQTPGDAEGQGSLACCSPWGHEESDMTEQLNNLPIKQSVAAVHPWMCTLRRPSMRNQKILILGRWGADLMNDFSKPYNLHTLASSHI